MKYNTGSIVGAVIIIIAIVAGLFYIGFDPEDLKNIVLNIWNFIKTPVVMMWEAFKSYILWPIIAVLKQLAQPN